MQRLELYMRRLGYQPWAAFELEGMHNNVIHIRKHGLLSSDCWFRQTGRTTKGLLTFLAETMDALEGGQAVDCFVYSPYGIGATERLADRCEDLRYCLGIMRLKIKAGRGGYEDHAGALTYPVNLHLNEGVTHVWNAEPSVTCLECLAIR